MKKSLLLFLIMFCAVSFAQSKSDTLLLVSVNCYLNDTISEAGESYEYDDNLNCTMSSSWDIRLKYVLNFVSFMTYDDKNKLIQNLTYADSVLIDSIVYQYSNNILASSYERRNDLDNYQITEITYSKIELPLRKKEQVVTFSHGHKEIVENEYYFKYDRAGNLISTNHFKTTFRNGFENKEELLSINQYDEKNNLIESAKYRIEGYSWESNLVVVNEVDTIDYSDSLISRSIFIYDEENRKVEERHYKINNIPTSTKRVQYDSIGRIYKEELWNPRYDSLITSFDCSFYKEEGLSCVICKDYISPGMSFSYCKNDKGQILEDTSGGHGFMTIRNYIYNENGYLLFEYETSTFNEEQTTRKIIYSYKKVNY